MNPIFTFTKKIKDGSNVQSKEIDDDRNIGRLNNVLQKLDTLPHIANFLVSEMVLDTNPKRWVAALIGGYPNSFAKTDVEYLLHDFTDKMKTGMREDSKYAPGEC